VDWVEEVACEEYPVRISSSGAARRRATGGGKPETDKLIWAETLCCLFSRSLSKEGKRVPLCKGSSKSSPSWEEDLLLACSITTSGIQHRSEELKADIRHLSGKEEEQGFHIRYRVEEPEVESGDDFRFLYS
jgi:hypothetical protein